MKRTSVNPVDWSLACSMDQDVFADWTVPAGTRPPQGLTGVNRLVLPELMVET